GQLQPGRRGRRGRVVPRVAVGLLRRLVLGPPRCLDYKSRSGCGPALAELLIGLAQAAEAVGVDLGLPGLHAARIGAADLVRGGFGVEAELAERFVAGHRGGTGAVRRGASVVVLLLSLGEALLGQWVAMSPTIRIAQRIIQVLL